jgi:hypothetical protein
VTTAADSVSGPSDHHQYEADDEEKNPDDQNDMCVGEGREEAREEQPQDDKDDSGNDHDVYLFSA